RALHAPPRRGIVAFPMDDLRHAVELARAARENAYAPYSGFRVGAAVKVAGHDLLFSGCNVENASFGAGVCAERVAMFSLRAAGRSYRPEFLVVVTDADPPSVPCALCLQVLSEFCPPDFLIHLADTEGVRRTVRFDELLPEPFQFERDDH
ncbi:MAG: cytidine deaminase, partial [Spirochaetaceae bacterium]